MLTEKYKISLLSILMIYISLINDINDIMINKFFLANGNIRLAQSRNIRVNPRNYFGIYRKLIIKFKI